MGNSSNSSSSKAPAGPAVPGATASRDQEFHKAQHAAMEARNAQPPEHPTPQEQQQHPVPGALQRPPLDVNAPAPRELERAAELVQKSKARYDECEQKRMTAVMNGSKDQDTAHMSCEDAFIAFKKAFDYQLMLESKLPPVGR